AAVERIRLLQETEAASQEREQLFRASQAINAANNFEELLQAVTPIDFGGGVFYLYIFENFDHRTATYIEARSLFVVDLEHGLSVAVYGMFAARQLPLESYLGFTLFKNGLAVAYGGAWLLGPHANFGMNIFEPYRGGESGFMMCQVLRVYRQRFGVRLARSPMPSLTDDPPLADRAERRPSGMIRNQADLLARPGLVED
ncbi:MAG: hypothetical protein HC882_06110, partial [Acidobacteria bacterium]|nr:hypothetical protein [Acidobacteriota bacterium]